mgnify:CR=1 FL=1
MVKTKVWRVAVSIVAVSLLVAAIVMSVGAQESDERPVELPSSSESRTIEIEVTEVEDALSAISNGTYDAEVPILEPFPGNQFILVFVNFTNNGQDSVSINPLDFELYTSNGWVHMPTYEIDHDIPDGVQAGRSVSFALPFEVADNTTLREFRYVTLFDEVTVPLSTHEGELNITSSADAVEMEVLRVMDAQEAISNGSYDGEIILDPSPGNRYILVEVNMTNNRLDSLDVNPLYFELHTADGLVHEYAYGVEYNLPDGIQPGFSEPLVIPFEISADNAPTELVFDNFFTNVSAEVPS